MYDLLLVGLSIGIVFGVTILIRNILYRFKTPTGKKGGIISLETAIAACIVLLTIYITESLPNMQKYILIIFSLVLAYIIVRDKWENKEYYFYQLVFSILLGMGAPLGLKYLSGALYATSGEMERIEAPEGIIDMRREASLNAPEMAITDGPEEALELEVDEI